MGYYILSTEMGSVLYAEAVECMSSAESLRHVGVSVFFYTYGCRRLSSEQCCVPCWCVVMHSFSGCE